MTAHYPDKPKLSSSEQTNLLVCKGLQNLCVFCLSVVVIQDASPEEFMPVEMQILLH